MAAQQPPLQYDLETDEELETKLCEKGLKVVELYSEWCGPCKSVIPTFKKIRLDQEDESTLQFLTVCGDKCQFLEAAADRGGNSEPLFLLYRNGALKQKVEGANTPSLKNFIMELTPMTADADELEENPLYLARREREKAK
ncbi:hypothetical protein BSKO_02169 [Bryopsis sp. KO-2023]|nr:hypothetical protein BSKO_02169 [Bryopsis sp. KO-2023]